MYSDEVYIIFERATVKRWWLKFIHPEISHCYMIKPDKGRWIVYNKSVDKVEIYTINTYDDILAESLVVRAGRTSESKGVFNLNTCVGNIKQYLGINNPFIITPYQLLKRLQNG